MARIVIADDHKFSRHMLAKHIRDLGHEIIEAEHGLAALELMAQHDVDAMVADLHMPEMGALELLKHAQADGLQVPTVVVGSGINSDEQKTLEHYGVEHFVAKPFSANEIEMAVSSVLK